MRPFFAVFVLGLAGCYASEKAGKDIQDTSRDVNQGGIHLDNGALGVRRPRQPATTESPLSADGGVAAEAGTISM